jgi:hypothetical protein
LINPDWTLVGLLGPKKNLPDKRPDGHAIFDYSQRLTAELIAYAWQSKYNMILDFAIPPSDLLKRLRQQGYIINIIVMQTPARLARKREVHRDLNQLNWGRPGLRSAAQQATADEIKHTAPSIVDAFADYTVYCNNTQSVMQCSDGTRVRPARTGPRTTLR